MIAALKATPAPVLLLVLSFLCPSELSLFIGDFRMPPHRLVLLLLTPISLILMAIRRDIAIKSFDLFFLLFAIWTVGVFMLHMGQDGGLKYGGSLALESLGGYLVARVFIRDARTFVQSLKTLLLAVLAAGLIALPETLFGQHFVHDALRGLTGYIHPTNIEQRLGFTRAYGTFDHPIHFGTFAASVLAMVWFAEDNARRRRIKAGLIAGVSILGLSSAPILCLALQFAMLIWERITRTLARRVSLLLVVFAVLYALASLVATRSPIAFIATNLTLDPWTGYYRLQIWEHGLNNVLANPWTGIGLADWQRPWWMISSTVDAFWLVLMMREGIPAIALLALAIALLGRLAYSRAIKTRREDLRRLAMGWTMSLIALMLVACTVHYWNVLYTYFFFVLGLGGVFADARPAPMAAAAPKPKGSGIFANGRAGVLPLGPAWDGAPAARVLLSAGNIWRDNKIWGPPARG